MTPREQLADQLDNMHIQPLSHEMAVENSRIVGQAAAELRKKCATCAEWMGGYLTLRCPIDVDFLDSGWPSDGSGFCSLWTPRTSAPEGE